MTSIIIAGDVCEDAILVGTAGRMSRETPGLPIVLVETTFTIDGGAAVPYRQAQALQSDAYLIPTGRPALKSRLFAANDGASREIARWDRPWPPQDAGTFREMFRARPQEADALLYSQVRRGAPQAPIVKDCRSFKGLRVADAHHPAYFAGFDVLKIGLDDAWAAVRPPRPSRTPLRALEVAESFASSYGYELVVITLGASGYAAHWTGGQTIFDKGLQGGRRTAGAGDIFSATLTVCLAQKEEIRDALWVANFAAGLACRKEEHLATVTKEEIDAAYDAWSGEGHDLPAGGGAAPADRPD